MERVSGTALWRQIETALEKDIADRVWAPGEKLPTEADFAQRFGVNRHTVRRALSELQERGLIRIEQGRGMFVQESVVDYPLTRRTRFTESISAQSRVPGHRLHKAFHMPADREVADALGIIRGREVLCLETIGLVDERPLIFGRHHFPCPRFRGLEDMFVKTGSITTSLKRFGVADYFRRRTAIMAVLPTPEEAVILQQPRMRPVLRYEALNTDETGEPVEFTIGLFAGDRAQLLVEDWD